MNKFYADVYELAALIFHDNGCIDMKKACGDLNSHSDSIQNRVQTLVEERQ